jgi:endoglucanase
MKSGQAWSAYQAATDLGTKRILYQIAATPWALWLGGASSDGSLVKQVESAAMIQGATPVFVLYAIPHRDCGGYSSGGLSTTAQYKAWVDGVRSAIAGRPAIVIVEPDAIGWSCLPPAAQANRIAMLKYALTTLSQDPNTWAYVHAGSSGLDPNGVATALKQIGIANARGFAVNVSGFDTTASEIKYGKAIDAALGMQKHFVIDTSRNGLGRYTGNNGAPSYCNPPGRAVGTRPTAHTGDALVDAFLWVKRPGGSDGNCRPGEPPAGQWYQSYAIGLVQRALAAHIIENWPLPG